MDALVTHVRIDHDISTSVVENLSFGTFEQVMQ